MSNNDAAINTLRLRTASRDSAKGVFQLSAILESHASGFFGRGTGVAILTT